VKVRNKYVQWECSSARGVALFREVFSQEEVLFSLEEKHVEGIAHTQEISPKKKKITWISRTRSSSCDTPSLS